MNRNDDEISKLLERYGTSLAETRLLLPELTEAIKRQRAVKPPTFPQVPQLFTAEEIKEFGVELEPGWMLKMTPDETEIGFSQRLISPQGEELSLEDVFVSPEGKWVTRAEMEAMYAPAVGIEPELDELVTSFSEVVASISDLEQRLAVVVGPPERDRLEMELAAATTEFEEFFQGLIETGRTDETEVFLRALGASEAQIEEFFGAPAPAVQAFSFELLKSIVPEATQEQYGEIVAQINRFWRTDAVEDVARGHLGVYWRYRVGWDLSDADIDILAKAISESHRLRFVGTDPTLWTKATASFQAGCGDVLSNMGWLMQWIGRPESEYQGWKDLGEIYQSTYMPPANPQEFTWRSLLDPEWWATSVTRAVPFTLALIPAALGGAYGGATMAGVLGLGKFFTLILASIGAAAVSRPMESAMEAAGTYQQAIAQGMSEEEADAAADKAFRENMVLAGMDVGEFAMAFFPVKGGGTAVKHILLRRIASAGGKIVTVGVMEAAEEGFQDMVQRRALGEEVALDPRMTEAMAIGFIFGAGMGGTGAVYDTLVRRIKNDMSPELLADLERFKSDGMAQGLTEDQAELQALDKIAETPEGAASIEETMLEIREKIKEIEVKPIEIELDVFMEIPESVKVVDAITADNWMKTVLQKVGKVPPIKKVIEWGLGSRILVNRQSEAIEDIIGQGKFLHTEILRRGEGSRSLVYWTLFNIDPNPVKLFGFNKQAIAPTTRVKPLTKEADGTLEDIFTHPERYSLTWKQMQYVTKVHQINTLILNMLKKEGVAPDVVGESWWVHRVVEGKYDPNGELHKVRGKPGVRHGRIGAKAGFEMHRKAPTMAEGIKWGIQYGRNPAEYVSTYMEEAFKKIADARFEKYIAEKLEPLAKMGVLPTEELLRKYPEVVERAIITAEELADVNSFTDKINRAIRGERLPEQTLRAIERRFPELGRRFRALVEAPVVEVKQLRELLAESDKVIKSLTAQLKAKEFDVAAIKRETVATIPDEQKLTEAFKIMDYEDRLAFRSTMESQLGEIGQVLTEQDMEAKGIEEFLKTDPVASYRGTIGKRKASLITVLKRKGFPESFTIDEARFLMMGATPKTIVKGRVPRSVVVDELADHFKMGEQQLIDHIEFIRERMTVAEDLKVLIQLADNRQKAIKGMLGILDGVDTKPEFIPKAEPGMPEAGLQQDIFGYQTPVFPKGKGEVTQISMDEYAKLAELWKKAGLPEDALPVAIKPKVEGIKGLEAETQFLKVKYDIPPVESAAERKVALEALRKEVKELTEARRMPYWEAKAERAYRMQQVRQPGIDEGYIMHPFGQGRKFDQEFIDAFNKFFGHDSGLKALRVTADAAGILRILKAALDFSQPMIQGTLPWGLAHSYLVTNPKIGVRLVGAWYKCFFQQIGAFFNPGIMAHFMETRQDTIKQRIGFGGSSRAVFLFQEMQAVVGKGKLARMGETVLSKIPFDPYHRAEVSFFAGGEIVRDTFWEILSPDAMAKGQEFELARYLDLVTGIADPRAMGVPLTVRQLEQSFIWFSSAYTRSYLTLAAEIFSGKFSGAKARRAIAGFIVAGAIYYVAVQYAICMIEGKSDDEAWETIRTGFGIYIDPITGDIEWRPTAALMSIKIGDNYFGIGGGIYGLLRLLGNISATVQEVGERERIDLIRIMKHGSLNKRDNPFISWWYARSSALFSPIYEMLTGRDFLGYPIETPGEYATYIISLFEPIWVEQAINPLIPGMAGDREVPEDALETVSWIAAELLGMRVNPEYSWQRFYNKANEYIQRIPEEELDEKQKQAWREGTLRWRHLTDIQKINLLYRYPELYEAYEEAQADSELRASPHWKAWEGRQNEERGIYYERGNSLVERLLRGEIDTREFRSLWSDAGQNYGIALDMIEKEPAYQEIYEFFDRQREEGDKYLFEADMALAEYIQIVFADYTDEKGDYDWDAKDRAIDAYIEKWGADYYEIIRQMYAQKRLLDGLDPMLVRLSDDKDKLGRSYWRLPYKPIIDMDEADEVEGNIPAEYYALWKAYQALETDAERAEFILAHPDLAKDWRAEYRLKNPEADAMLALWGYGGKLQSMEAYDLVVKWGQELGIPLEQMGLGLPPHSLIDDYFELNKIVAETSGSSAEARLFKLEHPEYLAWGLEQGIWKDDLSGESIEALRITTEWRDMDDKYDALPADERSEFLEANLDYHKARRRRDAYKIEGFPEPLIDAYVEYYTSPKLKKPVDYEGDWYEDDWFLTEHPEFYKAMVNLGLWQPRDFSKVPTRKVFDLYKTYLGLPTGQPRLDFRARHPELDGWLVLKFGYTPITDRGKAEAEKTPWEELEEVERFKELF